jgi:hypothetical protein
MGAAGLLLVAQQGASLLDSEFEKLSPDLSATLHVVNSQLTEGLSASQIAVATIGLPLAYQLIKMISDARREKRERITREHTSKLEIDSMAARLRLEREHAASMKEITAAPVTSAPTPLPPAR